MPAIARRSWNGGFIIGDWGELREISGNERGMERDFDSIWNSKSKKSHGFQSVNRENFFCRSFEAPGLKARMWIESAGFEGLRARCADA